MVQKFGEIYCKSEILDKELGRNLRIALVWRNKARYDKHAEITLNQRKEVIKLAKNLLGILERKVQKSIKD